MINGILLEYSCTYFNSNEIQNIGVLRRMMRARTHKKGKELRTKKENPILTNYEHCFRDKQLRWLMAGAQKISCQRPKIKKNEVVTISHT